MGEERCETCRFWVTTYALAQDTGDCRKGLPVVHFDRNRDGELTHWGHWPLTTAVCWCGEFQPRKPLPVAET